MVRKPCPICGSKLRIIEREYHYSKENGKEISLEQKIRRCAKCGKIISVKSFPAKPPKLDIEPSKVIDDIKESIEEIMEHCRKLLKKFETI